MTTPELRHSRALEVRSRLPRSRAAAVRRHSLRLAIRFAILVAVDLAALTFGRFILQELVVHPQLGRYLPSGLLQVGPVAGFGYPGSTAFTIAVVPALVLVGAYGRQRRLSIGLRLVGATAIAGVVAAIPVAAVVGVRNATILLAIVAAAAALILGLGRALAEPLLRLAWPRQRATAPAVLVGAAETLDTRPAHAIAAPGGDYRVAARCALEPSLPPPARVVDQVRQLIQSENAEAIVLCDALPPAHTDALVALANATGSQLLIPARAIPARGIRPRLVWHHDQPFLELGAPVLAPGALIIKRTADLFGAVILLIVSLPVMAIIAFIIKLDSRGPILFRQIRAGLGGRAFEMLKFRTMQDGADNQKSELAHLNQTDDVRLFKIPQDPRVTAVGRILRRWSLDELPQLWNVLIGEMSLVGPRPFFESDFAAYEDHHFRRLDAKPGITGLWQVSGRSEVLNFEDVIYLDKQYIEQWSFWLDLSILFRTIPAVFRRTGAY